jgi:hypothetical protein
MKDIFHKIIYGHAWRTNDTICGRGSTMEATKNLRTELPKFLEKYKITSMIDAPCGDFSWMSTVEFPAGFRYIGSDIVTAMLDQNRLKHPGVEFIEFDITSDPLPDVDLFFCRDCLIHLKIEDVWKTIDNIARSNVKYVMITNYTNLHENYEIERTGDYRGIDLTLPPYNLPTPVDFIEDATASDPRNMAMWPIDVFRNLKYEIKSK